MDLVPENYFILEDLLCMQLEQFAFSSHSLLFAYHWVYVKGKIHLSGSSFSSKVDGDWSINDLID